MKIIKLIDCYVRKFFVIHKINIIENNLKINGCEYSQYCNIMTELQCELDELNDLIIKYKKK